MSAFPVVRRCRRRACLCIGIGQGERNRKQWSGYTSHWGTILVRREPNARGGGLVPTCQTVKQRLSPHFGVFGIFEGGSLSPPKGPPACPAWGEGRIAPALQSTRTPLSASRESWLRGSPLRGETRRRSALFHASGVRSVAGGSSYPDGSAGTVGRVQRFKDSLAQWPSPAAQPLYP